MKPYMRRYAREYALQALYEWILSGNNVNEIEVQFFNDYNFKKTDTALFRTLLHGVVEKKDSLDEMMNPFLDRKLSELNLIELIVMRMAIFELVNSKDVPIKVIINEALDLSKKFGSEDGHKYVNGVLDKVARQIREEEMES